MYEIEFSYEAREDLDWFEKHEQNEIVDGIEASLTYEPAVESRNRKRLRPNAVAEWELRLGKFRVFYDVNVVVRIVSVVAIGEKVRSAYRFRGEERDL
jgi:mRNA-degrading endonuclease RelE of RelBE toxin-antitoxin system